MEEKLRGITGLSVPLLFLVYFSGTMEVRGGPLSVAEFELGPPSINGSVVSFDISVRFTPEPGSAEQVVFFALDVRESSGFLTGGGTNFSAFSFVEASPLLDDWSVIADFGPNPLFSTVELETFTSPLASNVHHVLGTLNVDILPLNLPGGLPFTVSIEGLGTVVGFEDPPGASATFDFSAVTFARGAQSFIVPISPIPEPSTILLCLAGMGAAVRAAARRKLLLRST